MLLKILVSVFLTTLSWAANPNKETVLMLREFENCPNWNRDPIKLINRTINILGRGRTAISVAFQVERVIERLTKTVVTVTKCKSRSEPGTCEQALKFDLGNACVLASQKNQLWSAAVQSLRPKFSCPIQKTLYRASNVTFDVAQLRKIVPDFNGYYWRIKLDLRTDKERILCGSVGCDVGYINHHGGKP